MQQSRVNKERKKGKGKGNYSPPRMIMHGTNLY